MSTNQPERPYLLIVETNNGTQVHRISGQDVAYASLKASPVLRSIGTKNIHAAYLVPQSMCTVLSLPIDDNPRLPAA